MVRPLLLVFAACTGDPSGDDDGVDNGSTDADGGTGDTDVPAEVIRDPRFDGVALILDLEVDDQVFASGVSIAVREQGQITWAEGFGSADPDESVAVTPATRFQIGSTTKQMTAALVLRQVEAGTFALEDHVSTALPDVSLDGDPTWADDASLEILLSHQGGIVDYIDWVGSSDDDQLAAWHEGFFKNTLWANNPPGAFWNYSNPNFTVSGLAAEAHDPLGRYYPDMMVEDLFLPLGMEATVARKDEVEEPYATSTGLDALSGEFGTIAMDDQFDSASVRPAGLVWSTPTDMTSWGSFLLHGDPNVLSDALRAEIQTPRVSTLYLDDHVQYGLGLFVYDLFPLSDGSYVPLTLWEHAGNTLSMTSAFLVLPEQDVVVSILSNGYADSFPQTIEALLHVVVEPFPEPSDYVPTVDPEVTALHVGSYDDPHNVGPIEITPGADGGLEIAMPLLDDLGYDIEPELIAITSDFFYIQINGLGFADLAFVRDPAGGPSLWARSRTFVGERVPPDLPARPLPPADRAPPVLDFGPLPTSLLRPPVR